MLWVSCPVLNHSTHKKTVYKADEMYCGWQGRSMRIQMNESIKNVIVLKHRPLKSTVTNCVLWAIRVHDCHIILSLCRITVFRSAVEYGHYSDVIMSTMASQITEESIVCAPVCSGADKKHQSSVSLSFGRGIYRWPVDSPHNGPETRKIFSFDDIILICACAKWLCQMQWQ